MKKLILFLFLVAIYANATTYKSVLTNSAAKWSIIVTPNYEKTDEWITNSDTLINSHSYTSLSKYSTFFNSSSIAEIDINWRSNVPNLTTANKEYFIRESQDASKLYLYDKNKNDEYLISDLNLQKGDTFHLPGNSQAVLRSQTDYALVDSIYTSNGLKHVQLNLNNTYNESKLTFIEGVGPNIGVLCVYGAGYINQSLFCLNCFKNDIIFYKQFNDRPCIYDLIDGIKDIQLDGCKLKKNSNSIVLSYENFAKRSIEILDCTGRVISQSKFNSSKVIEASSSTFSKGVYLLKVLNWETNKIQSFKVIL